MERGFEVTWTSLWRIVGMLILVAVLYRAMDIWISVILAIVISSALDPSVNWLEKKKIPRIVGTLAIFIVLTFILALVMYAIVPIVLSEVTTLLQNIGTVGIPALGLQEAAKVIGIINQGLTNLTDVLLSGNVSFVGMVSQFVGGVTLLLSTVMLAFYLTVDRDGVEKFMIAVLPAGYEEKILDVYFKTRKKIGSWLYGQIFLSLSVGLASFLGLWFIGVQFSLVLGLLSGIMEIVPFVGPILSGAIALVIAASTSPGSLIYVFLLYLLIHEVESWILTPVFMRMTTSLHPAAILISLLVGAELFGVVGLILAVPVTVMLQEMVDSWSAEKSRRKASTLSV
ncbi:MAG: AI-2E family transporter [Patescibacteria group bacterium]|nr:AI-2E family transporter [Patescibacteria group bacterium]